MTGEEAAPGEIELVGSLDGLDEAGELAGWLWSPSEPGVQRRIVVLADGVEIGQATADLPRPDLAIAGVGDGAHAFRIRPALAGLRPGATALLTLRDAATGREVFAPTPMTAPPEQAEPVAAEGAALAGNLDQVTEDGWISGWCWYPAEPAATVDLVVLVDGAPVGEIRANLPRPDLARAGIGDGAHGFSYAVPWSVMAEKAAMSVEVRDTRAGECVGVPVTLQMGLRAAADARVEDLERQIRMLRAELDIYIEQARGRDEDRAARDLFRTVAAFFHDLADAPAEAGFAATGLRGTLADFTSRFAPLVLAVPDASRATVLLQADSAPDDVHRVLAALIATGCDSGCDIVLLDDGTAGAEMALMPAVVRNLRYHRASASLAAARNEAVASARAGTVVFLSARAIPHEGWLDALLATLDDDPLADMAGARMLRADGCVEADGLAVASDLATKPLGGGRRPDDPAIRLLHPADALGDTAVAVRRDAVLARGGLDRGLDDAALALIDLSLALRAAGRRVLCQPRAEFVRLAGGVRASADAEQRARLRRKWRAKPVPRSAAGWVGHALVVDRIVPRPDRDAGSVIIFEQMLVLRDLGWRVTYAAAETEAADPAAIEALERRGIEVARAPDHGSATAFLRAQGGSLGLVVVGRHVHAKMLFERIGDLAPAARRVFLPHDLHFLRQSREAALAGRAAAAVEDTRRDEIACVAQADATLVHSDHELALLAGEVPPDKLHLLRWIVRAQATVPGFAQRRGALFVGGFLHPPNVDGVGWLLDKVLPILRRKRAGIVLHIVGSDVPERIAARAAEDVVVHGWVPDLAALLDRMRLTVAPLRYGAGFKGKVATSLAAGVPVVASAVAVEGTGLRDGEGVIVADEPMAFAQAMIRLHEDADAWGEHSTGGLARCEALYSPQAAREVWRTLLGRIGLPAREG